MKNLSHRYNINGTRSRHGRKYKYKILNIKCVSVRSWLCNKQDLSNIWSWIHEKVKQHWGSIEKSCSSKKACIGQNTLS